MYSNTARPSIGRQIALVTTQTTSSSPGNLIDTTTGNIAVSASQLSLYFSVTGNTISTPAAAPTNKHFRVQTSVDGGTTWLDAWRSTEFTTSTATRIAHFRRGFNLDFGEEQNLTPSLAAATTTARIVSSFPLARDVRVFLDAGTVAAGTANPTTSINWNCFVISTVD